MNKDLIRIDQSIKDASQLLRDLNEDGEDFDVEGDFGEYNNNIVTIGTRSKQPLRQGSNNTASLRHRDGQFDQNSQLSLKYVRDGQSLASQGPNDRSLDFGDDPAVEGPPAPQAPLPDPVAEFKRLAAGQAGDGADPELQAALDRIWDKYDDDGSKVLDREEMVKFVFEVFGINLPVQKVNETFAEVD